MVPAQEVQMAPVARAAAQTVLVQEVQMAPEAQVPARTVLVQL